MQAIGNLVHEIGPQPPLTGGKFYQGIYQTATGSVKNNIVYMISGAGIHLWHDANHIDIINNTVFNNWIGIVFGGGNYIRSKGPCDYINVANNIVFDNTGYGIDETGQNGSHNIISHNLVFQNPENFFLNVSTHSDDIIADPQFVNYVKTGGGDYHLKRKSPARDKGLETYAPSTDYDGTRRPRGSGIDIGAFEFK
jgi:parallel beta-helix repeat protein